MKRNKIVSEAATDEEFKRFQKIEKIIFECMELNGISPSEGITCMFRMIAGIFAQGFSHAEFASMIKRMTDFYSILWEIPKSKGKD